MKKLPTKDQIAIRPLDADAHEYCSICGDDDIVLVIKGGRPGQGTNCYYCGSTVVLCSKHAGQMLEEVKDLNLFGSVGVKSPT